MLNMFKNIYYMILYMILLYNILLYDLIYVFIYDSSDSSFCDSFCMIHLLWNIRINKKVSTQLVSTKWSKQCVRHTQCIVCIFVYIKKKIVLQNSLSTDTLSRSKKLRYIMLKSLDLFNTCILYSKIYNLQL